MVVLSLKKATLFFNMKNLKDLVINELCEFLEDELAAERIELDELDEFVKSLDGIEKE